MGIRQPASIRNISRISSSVLQVSTLASVALLNALDIFRDKNIDYSYEKKFTAIENVF